MALNKGEWSEVYTFLKLLSDGILYAADADLNAKSDIYYILLKIIRSEIERDFIRGDEFNINLVDSKNDTILASLPVVDFTSKAALLLQELQSKKEKSFDLPAITDFMNRLGILKFKSKSDDKRDITIKIHDPITGLKPTLGFSIKSKLGGDPTIFNSNVSTHCVFKIIGTLTEDQISEINAISNPKKGKLRRRIQRILELGCELIYFDADPKFKANLQMIDSCSPEIIAAMLMFYYKGEATSISMLTRLITDLNPCNYDLSKGHPYYEYKIKKFLTEIALGMTGTKVWKGRYDATGGFIIVKEDGDLVCYHVYNMNDFQEYLFNNTRLDTPSSGKHKFAHIYSGDDGNLFFNLNLHIRFP